MSTPSNPRHYATVEKALRFIHQQQHRQPSLADIAAHCAMSEYHFQKVFSEWAGVTPKRFLQALTREHCRQRLLDGESLLDCSNGAGLSSSGRLHDLLVTLEAVTPGELKSGGDNLQLYWGVQSCPFGDCFIACTERGIHQLVFIDAHELDDTVKALVEQWPRADIRRDQVRASALVHRIFNQGNGPGKSPQIPDTKPLKLWLKGSPFQFKVWEALLNVPPGKLCSYGDLATLIGQPNAARAVGSAVGKNPVAVLIPCHRVIQRMGVIGNYRWGALRKQALLGWEASSEEAGDLAAAPLAI